LIRTPAAIAATSTIAMNTMSVPIPTWPRRVSSLDVDFVIVQFSLEVNDGFI